MRRHASVGQYSLFGIADAAPADSVFLAVFPDADTSERVADLAREIGMRYGLHGEPLHKDRLHVTLHKLGTYAGVPADLVRDVSLAAAELDEAAFGVMFDRVGSFMGGTKKPCVLLGPEDGSLLHRFHRVLAERLFIHGRGKELKSDFTPHVTLRYDTASVPIQPVPPIAWTVREFVLVHSLVGKTEHRILGRWPLHG